MIGCWMKGSTATASRIESYFVFAKSQPLPVIRLDAWNCHDAFSFFGKDSIHLNLSLLLLVVVVVAVAWINQINLSLLLVVAALTRGTQIDDVIGLVVAHCVVFVSLMWIEVLYTTMHAPYRTID